MPGRRFCRKSGSGIRGPFLWGSYLAGRGGGKWQEVKGVIPYDQINTLYFEPRRRINMQRLNPHQALKGFSEVHLGFSSEEAGISASRCFSCGTCNYCYNCYFFCPEGAILLDPAHQERTVDLEHCKGCGTCAKTCPRHVVEMRGLS
ncbi:MAG: 4Fe-4S dicluster domain-containing protein, partial [Pseudomonadota bacterium]